MSLETLLDIDIRMFNACVDGYLRRRETQINDDLLVGHIIAGKTSAAVWGDKSFKTPIEPIRLIPETIEEKAERIMLQGLKEQGLI